MLAFILRFPVVVGVVIAFAIAAARWFLVPEDRKRCEWMIVATALAIPANAGCEALTMWLSHLVPMKYDLYVYRIDSLFGQPSFFLGQFAATHPWSEVIGQLAYGALPCAVLAIWAAYLWLREAKALRVLLAFVLNLFLAVPLYLLFPVCGPVYAFKDFPAMPPHLVPHLIAITAPPNGVPSVHTSTALLILWFAWRWPIGRLLAIPYLAMILFATMASGQHYFFDLICAVPYAFAIYLLTEKRKRPSAATTATA